MHRIGVDDSLVTIGESDRYEAFARFHDEYVAETQSRLSPIHDRPTALLTYGAVDQPE